MIEKNRVVVNERMRTRGQDGSTSARKMLICIAMVVGLAILSVPTVFSAELHDTASCDSNTVYCADSGTTASTTGDFIIEQNGGSSDLIVTAITLNCGYLFANESNNVSATIMNNGTNATGAFNVSFVLDSFSEEVRIDNLTTNSTINVSVTDTTQRHAGKLVEINVTADCNAEVGESNETNNASTMNTTVVNNGYKGKRYTGGEDITTWKTFELNGNLLYSVGDSYYLSASTCPNWTTYTTNWTASDLPLAGASVREARLYVPYTWDKAGVMPNEANLTFNGNAQAQAQHYSDDRVVPDSKPYGMLVYNVTADFNSTVNNAVLTNLHPGGGNVSIRGMLLVIISADDSEPERKIILNEGFDLLYGGSSKCTTPAEATAYAPLDAIALAGVEKATLITVAPGADGPEGDLLFNGQTWTDVWNFTGSTEIGIKETNVTSYLNAAANEAGIQSSGDWMEASNAFLVVEYLEKPDLIISAIELNCGYLFANESNNVTATIKNNGTNATGAFNVSFVLGGFSEEVRIDNLTANSTIDVSVTDTTLRHAGELVEINVTADCNVEVGESNETNNASTMNTTVVNNGYKGKRYTGGEDITTWKTFELNGNLLYSVGDSYYLSATTYPHWTTYTANWTASDLPLNGASVREARLYVPYTWDKAGVMPNEASLTFNGNAQAQAQHYSDDRVVPDSKPYGMLVYNVTVDFTITENNAVLTNSHPGGGNVSIRGMLLVIISADDSEPERKIIINEGFDLLYGGSSKCTTPAEATAYAPLDAINLTGMEKATLITVAPGAGPNEGDLLFNGQTWTDVWNFTGSTEIGIKETNVTSYLNATANEAGIQSSEDWMEASNAFLVVEYQAEAPTCTVSLTTGWNLISVPLNLSSWVLGNESAVGTPFNVTPKNSLASIYRYNSTSGSFDKSDYLDNWGWWPATGSESFAALEPGKGYWVWANNECDLSFTGTEPYDLDVTLNGNWNLIGWYSLTEALLGNESVVGDPLNVTPENSLKSVYRYNSTTGSFDKCDHLDDWGWEPATGSDSFTALEPCKGYWVWAENECVWWHKV